MFLQRAGPEHCAHLADSATSAAPWPSKMGAPGPLRASGGPQESGGPGARGDGRTRCTWLTWSTARAWRTARGRRPLGPRRWAHPLHLADLDHSAHLADRARAAAPWPAEMGAPGAPRMHRWLWTSMAVDSISSSEWSRRNPSPRNHNLSGLAGILARRITRSTRKWQHKRRHETVEGTN